jgi:hypothetical protein
VTDGRMSGASGKVPAAIHVSPEAAAGGSLAAPSGPGVGDVDGAGASGGDIFASMKTQGQG